MAYHVQGLHNVSAGAMFPRSCTFTKIPPEYAAAMLARGALKICAVENRIFTLPKHQKVELYLVCLNRRPQDTPEFSYDVDGHGAWRVPSYINEEGLRVPNEVLICMMINIQPRWQIVGTASGQHLGDTILTGPLAETEYYDLAGGRFPPTLAELGKPAAGVDDGPSRGQLAIMPGRPPPAPTRHDHSTMDPQPTSRRLRLSQAPPRQNLHETNEIIPRGSVNRPPPRQSRPLRPPTTRPYRPTPIMRSPSSSSPSSSSSSSSEEETPKKTSKKNHATQKKAASKGKAPMKRRPAPRSDEEEEEEDAAYSADDRRRKRGPRPSVRRRQRDDGTLAPRPRPAAPRQAAALVRRRVGRLDDEGEEGAEAS
ncbi:MAG: hypothetical protein LQ352_006326, partial [Teloschistes flavicans]